MFGADRNQRALQPLLPSLLRGLLAGAQQAALARDHRIHARHTDRERRRARPRTDFRRGTPVYFAILDAVRGAAGPPRDDQHQWRTIGARSLILWHGLPSTDAASKIYLQFDSMKRDALMICAARIWRGVRQHALENLERHGHFDQALVVHCQARSERRRDRRDCAPKALEWRCVRGVTFQPVRMPAEREFRQGAAPYRGSPKIRERVIKESGLLGSGARELNEEIGIWKWKQG